MAIKEQEIAPPNEQKLELEDNEEMELTPKAKR